jgi:trimeric autotransporter adhesin
VSATLHGRTGTSAFTVTKVTLTSITVEPVNPLVSKGTTVQLTATGNFSDGTTQDLTTQVSWTSGNNAIAEVNNVVGSEGVVTGLSVGNTSITATLHGIQGSTTVTVTAAVLTSIAITPVNPSLAKGTTVQLTATGTFSDGTTEDLTATAAWHSSSIIVAVVGNAGIGGSVTARTVGTTTITATQAGVTGSTIVTVTPAP